MQAAIDWATEIRAVPIERNAKVVEAAFGLEKYDCGAQAVRLLRDLFAEDRAKRGSLYAERLSDYEVGLAMLDASGSMKTELVVVGLAVLDVHERYLDAQRFRSSDIRAWRESATLGLMLTDLLRFDLTWCYSSMAFVWDVLSFVEQGVVLRLISATSKWVKSEGVFPPPLREKVLHLSQSHSARSPYSYDTLSNYKKISERFEALLKLDGRGKSHKQAIRIPRCDAWTEAFHDAQAPDHPLWQGLFKLWSKTTGAKPSQKKIREAGALIQRHGADLFECTMREILEAVGKPCSEEARNYKAVYSMGPRYEPTLFNEDYSGYLRGLIWSCATLDPGLSIREIGDAAERFYHKVRGIGSRSIKLGNACVWLLAEHGGMPGIAEVNRQLGRVRNASIRKKIENMLNQSATHQGISRDELDDLAVQNCGLTGVGVREQAFGDYSAALSIASSNTTKLVWHCPTRKVQKSVPKIVRVEHAEALKAFKADAKALVKSVQGQRDRLERALLHPRIWGYRQWHERLLNHPLMGWLTRRLIWSCKGTDGTVAAAVWFGGQLVTSDDRPLVEVIELDDACEVGLWHPIDATAETVAAWREWLMRHEVTQPFKQAHREVYLLTDAERSTETYSNRFAAHIIRQHQLLALCQARGWSYQLMGNWDGNSVPTRLIPEWNLRVEFWVQFAGDNATSGTGVWLYVSTDQVRFYDHDPAGSKYGSPDSTPIPLDQVPLRVFSELMRDVDLFVGVASVANDPNWQDNADQAGFHNYWHAQSFGDLSASAQTRREILEPLVTKLKIAERCSFNDKFLIVRGDKRTYKIHLGSTNILMYPNDQYLCIVPGATDAKAWDRVFLPFEGDQRLAVILSKAMMLAADTKIKDPTILRQIDRS